MKWIKLFENFNKPQTIIIVGGGISSLYCAYLIKKRFPKTKFTILEKEDECGGRVKMDEIDGKKIPTGANFTRVKKDKILNSLLRDLDIKIKPYNLEIDFTFRPSDVEEMISELKAARNKYDRSKLTFKEFGKKVLGDRYQNFIENMGYSDFEDADFKDTLDNYGLEDNVSGYQIADVPWGTLISKLITEIGKENIITNTEVTSIKKTNGQFVVNNKFKADGVIIASTVSVLRKLLKNTIYDQVESQEFLKIFAKTSGLTVDKYTISDTQLKKVIPIQGDVFNIAFTDNKSAKDLQWSTKSELQTLLSSEFKSDVKIKEMKKFFWKEGTHFYKPLKSKWKSRKEFIKAAQHPEEGIWVIGEVVAEKQGWVEGALSSVENISLFKK